PPPMTPSPVATSAQPLSDTVPATVAAPAHEHEESRHEVVPITGKVEIDFNSRTAASRGEDLRRESSFDRYALSLAVADAMKVDGSITRAPRVISEYLGREQQQLRYTFDLAFPGTKSAWRGSFGVGRDGTYQIDGNLRIE